MCDLPKIPPPVPPRQYFCDRGQCNHVISNNNNSVTFQTPHNPGGTQHTVFNQGFKQEFGNLGTFYGNNSVKFVEESFKGTCQNLETLITAVSSLANMLTSMQNAAYSTVAALIGFADQYKLLKSQLCFLFPSLPLFRWVRLLWRKLIEFLGLVPRTEYIELCWLDATSPLNRGADKFGGGQFSLANAIFWLFVIGGPYLIYKSVSNLIGLFENSRKWATGETEHYRAEALFDFQSQYGHELSFRAGELLRIAPKYQQPAIQGWILGSSEKNNSIGLIPVNYVKLLKRVPTSDAEHTLDGDIFNENV